MNETIGIFLTLEGFILSLTVFALAIFLPMWNMMEMAQQ